MIINLSDKTITERSEPLTELLRENRNTWFTINQVRDYMD